MNKTLYNRLKKHEKLLANVYYTRVLFNAKSCYLNDIADAWEQHTEEHVNRQWSCAHCAFNFLDRVGREYFTYKPETEKESTTTTTAGAKKPKTKTKPAKNAKR